MFKNDLSIHTLKLLIILRILQYTFSQWLHVEFFQLLMLIQRRMLGSRNCVDSLEMNSEQSGIRNIPDDTGARG